MDAWRERLRRDRAVRRPPRPARDGFLARRPDVSRGCNCRPGRRGSPRSRDRAHPSAARRGPRCPRRYRARRRYRRTLTTAGAEAMRSCGLNAHVAVDVIPHPVVPRTPMAPDAAWAILREHPSFRALSPATPFVLCLGFLTSAKRLFDVIDATRIVPVTLVLAGAMPEHEYGAEGYARVLHEVVRSPAGQHVVLSIGHVNEDTTTALYSLAVAAIVPRVGWSGSGAEATALGFGVPVVAGGLREADDGEGILPYTSIANLEQALHRLVTAAPRAVRPQTLATVRSPVAVAEAHLALYRRFLS